MSDILRKHDLSRDIKNVRREHLTVDEYKQHAAQKAEIRKVNAHINELKKKNPAELTPDEVELIRNQNDFMRSEIQKRDEKIAALSRKLGAKFVPFDIYSEDKLQFVAAELSKIGIPLVEENSTIYIPDYAQKTAAAVAASFRPVKAEGVREKIRLDIDRLIYCSINIEDLLNKLQERGYEIKRGKYLAVKPNYAERFVRLKTLGDAYLPKNLEQRIADKDNFPNAVREKFPSQNAIEKKIQVTIMDMVVAIKQFRFTPKKLAPKKIYAFQNDADINYLSEQLRTIRDFNFSSREQIYAKAEDLKHSIDEKTAKLKSMSDELPTLKSDIAQLRHFYSVKDNQKRLDTMEQVKLAAAREIADKYGVKSEDDIAELEKRLRQLPTDTLSIKNGISEDQLKLKRVSDLIAAYEKIVEGNYIDNLIRAQREQNRTLNNPNNLTHS